jgi:hypothetical protein
MTKNVAAVSVITSCWCCALVPVAAQQERPAEIIAAQIRTQGFRCDDPTRAEHEPKLSRPNEQVWVLRCANVTYRVRLVPDLAAHVERLD